MSATHPLRARLRAALAVLIVAVATAVVLATGALTSPAQAQPVVCSGRVTFYGEPNFGFPVGCSIALVDTCLGTGIDRPARSAINSTNRRVELYRDRICSERVATLTPGQTRSSIPSTQSFRAR